MMTTSLDPLRSALCFIFPKPPFEIQDELQEANVAVVKIEPLKPEAEPSRAATVGGSLAAGTVKAEAVKVEGAIKSDPGARGGAATAATAAPLGMKMKVEDKPKSSVGGGLGDFSTLEGSKSYSSEAQICTIFCQLIRDGSCCPGRWLGRVCRRRLRRRVVE